MKVKIVEDHSGPDDGYRKWVIERLDATIQLHKSFVTEDECDAKNFLMIPTAALSALQEVFIKHANSFSRDEHAALSQSFLLLAASLQTFANNPLFGSYLVLDQLKHHVEVIMSGKKGFAVVADEDEEDDEAEDSRH